MSDDEMTEIIEQKIIGIIHADDADYDFHAAMNALVHVIAFEMLLACPECRKGLAKQLKRRIPAILTQANTLAAMARSDAPCRLH
jgi:hypothetical protein